MLLIVNLLLALIRPAQTLAPRDYLSSQYVKDVLATRSPFAAGAGGGGLLYLVKVPGSDLLFGVPPLPSFCGTGGGRLRGVRAAGNRGGDLHALQSAGALRAWR